MPEADPSSESLSVSNNTTPDSASPCDSYMVSSETPLLQRRRTLHCNRPSTMSPSRREFTSGATSSSPPCSSTLLQHHLPHQSVRLDAFSDGAGPNLLSDQPLQYRLHRAGGLSPFTPASYRPPESVKVCACALIPSITRASTDQRRSAPPGVAHPTAAMAQHGAVGAARGGCDASGDV